MEGEQLCFPHPVAPMEGRAAGGMPNPQWHLLLKRYPVPRDWLTGPRKIPFTPPPDDRVLFFRHTTVRSVPPLVGSRSQTRAFCLLLCRSLPSLLPSFFPVTISPKQTVQSPYLSRSPLTKGTFFASAIGSVSLNNRGERALLGNLTRAAFF